MQKQHEWSDVTPRTVLVRQLQAEDPYEILNLVQTYVGQLEMRKSSKKKAYSVIKSFFSHNRCTLPADPGFRVRGDKPPVQARLTVKDVLAAYQAANLRYRSVIIFKWQSLMDNARLEYVCRNCGDPIVQQIRDGSGCRQGPLHDDYGSCLDGI